MDHKFLEETKRVGCTMGKALCLLYLALLTDSGRLTVYSYLRPDCMGQICRLKQCLYSRSLVVRVVRFELLQSLNSSTLAGALSPMARRIG